MFGCQWLCMSDDLQAIIRTHKQSTRRFVPATSPLAVRVRGGTQRHGLTCGGSTGTGSPSRATWSRLTRRRRGLMHGRASFSVRCPCTGITATQQCDHADAITKTIDDVIARAAPPPHANAAADERLLIYISRLGHAWACPSPAFGHVVAAGSMGRRMHVLPTTARHAAVTDHIRLAAANVRRRQMAVNGPRRVAWNGIGKHRLASGSLLVPL
jgi:hypothetical protein